jgi:hydrogenase expression/formation protein HypC
MCLGIPAKVIERTSRVAKVELGGVLREISLDLCPEAAVGDYVLVHAGFAIERLNEEDAKETLELLRQMAEGI